MAYTQTDFRVLQSELEKLLSDKFNNLSLSTLNDELQKDTSDEEQKINKIKWADKPTQHKYYYNKPTPMDVLFEEQEYIISNSYNGKSIYEWNIYDFTDTHIQNTARRMLMYSTVCKSSGNTDKNIAIMITAGFTYQLKGWGDNYLTQSHKDKILNSVKTENQLQQEDAVYTLIMNMIEHFIQNL